MTGPVPAGVHRLPVPLPFVVPALNAWLVDTGEGWLLIDTGMRTTAAWKALKRGFLTTGISWADLKTVILTHMHPDHVGLWPQVEAESGAALAMHVRDAELLNEFAKPATSEHWNRIALQLAGTPIELVGPVNSAFQLLTVGFPSVNPEIPLTGGERFGSLEVIWSPGHSPGHVCLYDHSRKVLFGGDHILETTSPNIGWLPEGDPLNDYLCSLDTLSVLEIDCVLPGHGEPIDDCRSWIERTTTHHMARLARIEEILLRAPATAHEIASLLWTRRLSPIDYRFAIFEVLAHLVHLAVLGRIERKHSRWSKV